MGNSHKEIEILWTRLKNFPAMSDFEKPLPLHFKRPLIHQSNPILNALHLQGSQSNIHICVCVCVCVCVCFHLVKKLAIDWDFIPEVKISIKHVINSEVKNIANSSFVLML
jgi:hypothetical protein